MPGAGIEPARTETDNAQLPEIQRIFHANRLLKPLDETALAAHCAGMTPEIPEALLNDKSARETTDWLEAVADREGWK